MKACTVRFWAISWAVPTSSISTTTRQRISRCLSSAQATAAAVFLARTGHDKAEIKAYAEREFGYDLSRSCDEIRPTYHHVESCQETVPQAITAFLESTDFEDALRTAVSLGGDSDTLAAITGGIAEAFYGVPENLKQQALRSLPTDLTEILLEWEATVN